MAKVKCQKCGGIGTSPVRPPRITCRRFNTESTEGRRHSCGMGNGDSLTRERGGDSMQRQMGHGAASGTDISREVWAPLVTIGYPTMGKLPMPPQ